MAVSNPRPAWALLMLCGWMSGAYAAADDLPQQCAAIGNDAERLACYDRIFRAPAATAAASPAIGAAVPTAVAPPATTAAAPAAAALSDDFGLTEAAKRAREPEESRQQRPESISGAVARVARQPAGELVVTLENGQVWTQLQVDPRARVAVGDTVTIKTAALGSFLLVTANRYATRVRRVK